VYFASRTHSQLSQFVAELRKTAFAEGPRKGAESTIDSQKGATDHSHQRPVRLIPLGSRQNLCINDEVRRKSGGSNEAIGDLCLELQKSSSSGQAKGKGAEGKKDKRCPYLPPADEPGKLNDFRDRALVS
jgi:chromosome transmission fidelity protein 1